MLEHGAQGAGPELESPQREPLVAGSGRADGRQQIARGEEGGAPGG
jgi:hypothetical protein